MPFSKGQSGNPKGRPQKGYSITEAFQSMFNENPEKKQEIVDAIQRKAKGGDPTALKLVWNYMDGLPPQSVKLSGDKDNPITHEYIEFEK